MKKIYNAPEAGLLCFAPVEALAADEIDFSTLVSISGSEVGGKKADAVISCAGDIKIKM